MDGQQPRSMFLLVQTEHGRRTDVAGAAARLGGVASIAETSGPYDVVANVDLDGSVDTNGLLDDVRRIDGVLRVLTAPVLGVSSAA